jgi:hypothetical protein
MRKGQPMATEFLREKLNALNNLIAQESMQIFQHELLVEAAGKSTGDAQVDEQVMKPNATNAKGVILASSRRLAVYKAKHAELTKELDSAKAEK